MNACTLIPQSPFRRNSPLQVTTLAVLFPALLFSTGPVSANPGGGVVVHGDISIANGGNGLLNVNQNSAMAIINWSDFSIAAGETTRFNQPGAQAAVLNRVTGGDPSAIFGALQGNGSVFVINPNGILVGSTGMIDVHGLVLSTLDLSNGEFLAGGDMTFLGSGDAGVVNLGKINAIGGDVFLFGNTVTNEGSITARDGTVGIGAGREVLLAAKSNTMGERVFVRAGGSGNTGILNTGSIEGAAVELKAHGNMYALAINNKGSIRAVGAVNQGGRAFLRGVGGSVSNSGSIEVSSSSSSYAASKSASAVIQAAYARVDGAIRAEGGSVQITGSESVEVGGLINVSSGTGKGGDVTVEGLNVAVGGTTVIDASGSAGGGSVRIGGGLQGRDAEVMNADNTTVAQGALIIADAIESGDGGSVVLWADGDTVFEGGISATGIDRGGFAEISGKRNLNIDGSTVDLGQGGFLLLDPSNFTVTDTVRNTIRPTLNAGSDVVIFTNGSDTLAGNGDIIFSSDFSGLNAIDGLGGSATTGSLSLLAYGDIFMRRDLINNGTGNINLVAGWDGMTPSDFAPGAAGTNSTGSPVVMMDSQIFADTSSYGNRNGSVYIGLETDKVTPTNVSTITVGSRNGETNVAAYNLVMVGDNTAGATSGDDRTAQLGYRASDVDATLGREAATGRIKVNVLNDVTMTAGTKTNATTESPSGTPGQYNYVQIGHGGRDAVSNGYNHSGEIIIQAGLGSDAGITGNIIGTAGANLATFVHIGHGGHGGGTASGSFSGGITVEAGDKGRVEMTAGTGRRAFAMIGHGGYDVDSGVTVTDSVGFHSGAINVSAGTDVIVTAGIGEDQWVSDGYSFGQIGHGGANSGALSSIQGHNGSITVEAGRGGLSGGIAFKAGDIDDNYAQLGHGGFTATSGVDADGHNGSINVDAIGDITFTAGTGQAFRGDSDGRLYAQLGHGGYNAGSNFNAVPGELTGLGHHGLIEVNSTMGNISFFGGDTALGSAGDGFGRIHYAQLGHGGYHVEGDHYGSVIVEATNGSIIFTAGATSDNATDGIRNSAQLGHGGYLAKGDHGRAGDLISVTAGTDITFTGGGGTQPSGTLRSYAQLGNGGYDAENPTALVPGSQGNLGKIQVVSTGGNITFTGGEGSEGYAQLGHGGLSTSGDHSGSISVSALMGAISFSGGSGADTYAQLGHGGRTARGYSNGYIEVAARNDISFRASTGSRSYVQLGHGGHDADSPNAAGAGTTGNTGAIRVASTNGSVVLSSGDGTGTEAYAQLGHGGFGTEGDHSGSITVRAANNVDATAAVTDGTGISSYVQLGHGGMNAIGNHSGAIIVSAGTTGDYTDVFDLGMNGAVGDLNDALTFVTGGTGAINFLAGFATDRYAQLGHGGRTARGDHGGSIDVTSLGNITFSGGTAGQTYSMLGHGGRDADNPSVTYYPDNDPLNPLRGPTAAERIGNNGNIAVTSSTGDVIFTTGSGSESFVQIGHGGSVTDGDHVGSITVNAKDVIFDASNTVGTGHYAQLGHGGYLASGGHEGDIVVNATGGIAFNAGTTGSYAQIGHGGYNDHRVTRGGTSPNYTQTNNNDRYFSGSHSGAINVSAGSNIGFVGGNGTGSYGQIGHGGFRNAAEAGEGHSGDISVVGGGTVSFAAQNGAQAYVQVGHGGYEAFGNHGYEVVQTEAGSVAATQAGTANLANGALAPGSVKITVDPLGSGAGTATFTDDGKGNLIDGALTVVGTVNYLTGEVSFTSNVNPAGDAVDVAYLHGGSDIVVDGGTAVMFAAGTGTNTNAQIGHGGAGSSFSSTLNIDPEESAPATNTSTTTYHLNTPSVDPLGTSGNITVYSGTGSTTDPNAAVTFTAGAGSDAYAQIGNGGRNARGDHRGEIEIAAAGDISFAAFNDPASTATTTNNSTINARLQNHASGTFTLAQTGNLERGTIVITYDNPIPPFSGTIYCDSFGRLFDNGIEVGSVTTAGVVTLTETLSDSGAGAANSLVVFDHYNTGVRSYVQIGHGGHDADNPNTTTPGDLGNLGNINVTSNTGAISFAAGSRSENYAQLGHGGYVTNGDHSGNIVVEALGVNGAISFSAGSRVESYTQLGHGGRSARGNFGLVDVDNDMIVDGDITVRTTGSIEFKAGSAGQTYAQLGHGGYDADTVTTPGNPSNRGAILVESNTGDISFIATGSVGANSYVQLGHGGLFTSGDFSGAITTRALGGSVIFTGGETTDSYAQLGHGGRGARGSHDGNIEVLGADGVTFTAGGVATVAAESSAALVDAAVAGGGATGALVNLANLDRSSLVITVNDPVLPEYATITSNSSGILSDINGVQVGTLSTAGVVTFNVAVSNAGASGLTVAYNHANYSRGSAQLGNGGSESDATGSAAGIPGMNGNIKVASTTGDITFTAGLGDTNYVQLGNGGYATSGDHTGSITVRAAGDVSFVAGATATTSTGTLASRANNYAQLGHGGMSAAGNHFGAITVSAGTDGNFVDASTAPLDFIRGATGGILFDAGTITDAYAQLGHGGRLARGSHGGEIKVGSYDTILFENGISTRTYVQLGHGGHEAAAVGVGAGDAGNSGSINVQSTAGAVEFRLAATNTSPGTDAYAQLGHGGNTTGGDHTGSIDVTAETNLLFRGSSSTGTGSDSYVQLGHGGMDASGNFNGDITATANTGYAQFRSGASTSTTTTAGNNRYALLGHGGTNSAGSFSGDIRLLADDAITFSNQSSSATIGSYTQLGHGGLNASSTAGHLGDIAVTSRTSSITFTGAAGSSTDSYTQLGHGGTNATGSHSGDIAVQSATTTTFTGGTAGIRNYAQLGHGGFNADALADEGHSGRIGVAAGTNLTFTAGSGSSEESYAQLGHGGSGATGNHNGDIVARAGNTLIFNASTGTDTIVPDPVDPINNPPTRIDNRGYAQLGHGGYAASGNHSGNITASSQLTGDFVDIGDFDGDGFNEVISMVGGATTTNPFSFLAGTDATGDAASDAYAQLGHGGRLATGARTGDILVDVERTVRFQAGALGARTYAQLGHGGHDAASVIDGLNPIALANSGDIDVRARTGAVNFLWVATNTATSSETYIQLGHGGFVSDPLISGVDAGGHNTGDIAVTAGTNVLFRSTDDATVDSNSNYAQLGHGGLRWVGNHSGDIAAWAGAAGVSGTVTFSAPNLTTAAAGISQNRYVQLGHGGFQARGDHSGDISVLSLGSISFRGGRVEGGYAQLGHGGLDADDTNTALGNTGDIRVASQTGNINFQWNASTDTPGEYSYVQLGHGGYQNSGDHSGDTTVRAGGLIQFRGGTGNTAPATGFVGNYAQLGHGGFEAAGNHSGDLTVSAGTDGAFVDVFDLNMNGIYGEASLDEVTFTSTGAGTITFLSGGSQADRYAQLGHGGTTARGDHGGNISVTALGNIVFTAGTGTRGYAMIGHGGHDADSHNPAYYQDNDPLNLLRGPTDAERIGNSGNIYVESLDGDILFTTGNATGSTFTPVQIGHGGTYTDGDHVGDITVIADADKSNAGSGGNITFRANTSGTTHSAQIGHGGFEASGGHTGAIVVTAGEAITFTGGSTNNNVQIGHGGVNDHRVTRGGSSPNYTQTNNNDLYYPGTHIGSVMVGAGTDITFTGGSGTAAYAQIGHGGYRNAAEAGEGHNGAISVIGGGSVNFTALNGAQGYVQVGHGGYEAFGNHGYEAVRSEVGSIAATQIGSASLGNGALAPGSVKITVDPQGTGAGTATFTDDGKGNLIDGALTVVGTVNYLTGEVAFTTNVNGAGDAVEVAYLHGGSDILVDGGTGVMFTAGTGSNTNAQIGHGGPNSSFSSTLNLDPEEDAPATNTSTTTYHLNTPSVDPLGTSGNITVLSGTGNTTDPTAAVMFTSGAGNDAYAQIGNGGRNARGDHRGEIDVKAAGDISFAAFNGGAATQTATNNGTLNNLLQNDTATSYTMAQTGNLERGTIVITYNNPLAGFTGTIKSDDAGRLFDGETQVGTVTTGGVIDLTVTVSDSSAGAAASVITFDHLNLGLRSYVQIGHGGDDADNPNATTPGDPGNLGNISVTSNDGAISFAAGSRNESYAQIGHGGYATNGDHSGNVVVEALGTNGAITFTAGNRAEAYAQLGHGGRSAKGNFGLVDVDNDMLADGDITARAAGAITFTAGSAGQTYAQLGHGGYDADTVTTPGNPSNRGNILVESNTGNIAFSAAGSVGSNAYVQLGHGGMATSGDFSGSIAARALGGSVIITGGEANDGYAQLGHGGRSAKGDHNGAIEVVGANGVFFTGGGVATVTGEKRTVLNDAAATGGGATGTLANTGNLDRSSFVITVFEPVLPEYATLTSDSDGILYDGNGVPVGSVATNGTVTFDVAVAKAGAEGISVAYNHINYSRGYVQLGNGGHDADPTGAAAGTPSQRGNINVVSTAGNIEFTAGLGDANYAQLGNGGFTTSGDHSGEITVEAAGDVKFTAGTFANTATGALNSRATNYAQLGHGGNSATGNHNGTISVSSTGGGITALAGNGTDTYVQIGHGGRTARGDHGGKIDVTALNDITFTGGSAGQTYAMIGHGGRDADNPNPTHYPDNDPATLDRGPTADERVGNNGNIAVTSSAGNVAFTTGSGTESFVQIGHGGSLTDGDHVGSITVSAVDILFDASNSVGTTHYAQLGHGGYLASGGHEGIITVNATGAITFAAGTTGSYTQIGHGGYNDHRLTRGGSSPNYTQANNNDRYFSGTHSGAISVSAGSEISFTGGAGTGSYGQIGHGGFRNAAEAGEGHSGDISVVGGGVVSFTAQNGSQAYVQVGHGGYEAFGNHGYEVVQTEAGSIAATQAGSATLANGALAPGSVKITVDPEGVGAGTAAFTDDGKGNLIDASLTVVGTVNYLTGEVAFTTNVNGAGDAVEVAYLHGGSDILVDGGMGVMFTAGTGSNTNAQIGHGGASSSFSSTLNIDPEESAPAANTSTTTYHLNTPSVDPLGMSGNVTVLSGTGNTTNPAAAVTFTSGAGNDAYAQIGNGGRNARGDHRGEIDVQAAGDISFVSFNGGAASQTVTNNGTLNNLLQNDAATSYTMAQTGNLERGTIVITYANPLAGFTGEIRGDSFGRLFDGDVQVGTVSTGGVIDLTVTVSDSGAGAPASVITFDHLNLGLRSYVQIGHGGNDADFPTALTPGDGGNLGNISVVSNDGAINFAAGSRTESYAQIGHGGYVTNGDHSGNIVVEALGANGAITFAAGNRVEAYAQLGHGGRSARGNFGLVDVDNDMILDGDITARSTGSIAFTAGSAGQTYAQLGHGGYDSDALTTAPNASNRGNILVESNTGDITFNAAGSVGANAYVQLGHGGHSTNGDFSGSITAHALGGSVVFTGGEVNERYAQIGHGGRSAKGDHTGSIDVMGATGVIFTGGGIATVAEESSAALIDAAAGGGGTATLAITSNIDRSSIVITVSNPVLPQYATLTSNAAGQLFDAMNNQVGTISAAGVVTFTTAVSSSNANAVTVAYNHSGYSRGYVQLGHGGYDSDPTGAATTKLSKSGEIKVASTSGDIAFTAGQGGNNYAQLGHGGMQTTGARSGAIEVISGGNVILNRGTADDAYVQIGHGTRSATGNSTGDISISASNGGSVLIQGSGLPATNGTAARTYGMIGHGGHDADGAHNGAIDITAEGQVLVQGGGTDAGFAMIGHGGNITDGALGDANDFISVRAGTGVSVLGGTGNDSFAMIGLGGLTSTGTREADILVETTNGNIVLTGGSSTTVDDSFAQIGNGGAQTTSTTQGNVKVRAGNGDVILTAGAGQVGTTTQTANYVQIGHGGHENIGNHGLASDTIAVLANNIVLNGGTTVDEAYAQIGNGGFGSNGNHAGNIQIDATGNLTVRGGTRVEAYALVGHGGVRDTFVPANANYTTGTRTGSILANVGGTTSLVDQTTIGFMGHLGTTGVAASSRLALITGQLDTSASLRKTTGLIQNMIGGGDVEIGVTNGNLLIDGTGVFANNANGIDLFATGDVTFMSSVQNAGSGGVAVVGGWDGSTGLMRTIDRDAVVPVPVLSLNADSVFADANGFGNAGGVIVGNAAQARAVAVGSANGTTRVAGNSVEVNGSATTAGSAAQIGFNEEVYRLGGGGNGVASTGAITVFTKEGGLSLQGGSVANAAAQIGHGGNNGISAGFSGDIMIDLGKGNATADLTVSGGSGSDSYARIGNGGRRAHGAKSGNISIAANSVELSGGTNNFTSAAIGHGGGEGSGTIGGSINVVAPGDVSLLGDSGDFASAQIGHGGAFYAGGITSALTSLQVGGDLEVRGGPGVMASAQVGHGGSRFSGNIAGTELTVDVTNDILVSGGAGNFSYGQIGFGGYGGAGNLSGDIDVAAGNEIVLMATNGSGASFAKIGHGDDLDLAISSLGSTGNWSGNINVGAGSNLTMIDAMIGHANVLSLGTSTGGVTAIGVSRNAPADPSGGTLTADAESEFAGEDELRIYLPSRENNEIASGAVVNGVTYAGASVDPTPTQGDDEFTINILGDEILFPNEHTNQLGSGPAPVNAARYAFYYDYIVLEALPEIIVIPSEGDNGEGNTLGEAALRGLREVMSDVIYRLDDELFDDVQRKRKKDSRRVKQYKLFYNGFRQYGPNGESIFDRQTRNAAEEADNTSILPVIN